MPLPEGPLPPGTRILLPIEVEVLRDDGAVVEVRLPTGYGDTRVQLLPRAALEAGEVLGG